jgi:osmoprotectant transport system substrate-binding protein
MKRTTTTLMAAGMAAILTLAACGGDDSSSDDTSDAAADTTAAAADTTADAGAATTAAGTETTAASADTTAAGGSGLDGVSITVGSADFSESVLIAEIYAQALEANGADVNRQLNIGARELYFAAIEDGEIQLQPEYTNSLLSFVLKGAGQENTAATVEEQVAALQEALPDNLTILTPSSAEDKDSVICNQETVDALGLATLSDLEANAGEVIFGAPPEFAERQTFGPGLASDAFKEFRPLEYGAPIADALSANAINCGNLFSTDPLAGRDGFVGLEDSESVVPPEAVTPLIAADLAENADVAATLDAVSAALDTEGLKAMMVQVGTEARDPAEVAAEWLAEVGLA